MSPLIRTLYYRLKPLLPRQVRWLGRRVVAHRILRRPGLPWPICAETAGIPERWCGWPEQRRFAFLLTHDVEGSHGVAQVKALATLEMELGFRSSFNFIPEGEYSVSPELRAWLVEHGFEVGVHDLHHEGHLFDSEAGFLDQARRINKYMREWDSCGFRAGFMLHQLEWMHALDIEYDLSTFDTDPFEPQPDAAGTIFPFWIPRPTGFDAGAAVRRSSAPSGSETTRFGYVELPYTLPQDSTLFLLLRHATDEVWKTKVKWLAQQGGMALLNLHPDYVEFGDGRTPRPSFPATVYRGFLKHVRDTFQGQYWQPLPRDLARWYRSSPMMPPPGVPHQVSS